jgi:hypothetical protein
MALVDLCHTANYEVALLIFRIVRPPRVRFSLLCQTLRGKTAPYSETVINRQTGHAETERPR